MAIIQGDFGSGVRPPLSDADRQLAAMSALMAQGFNPIPGLTQMIMGTSSPQGAMMADRSYGAQSGKPSGPVIYRGPYVKPSGPVQYKEPPKPSGPVQYRAPQAQPFDWIALANQLFPAGPSPEEIGATFQPQIDAMARVADMIGQGYGDYISTTQANTDALLGQLGDLLAQTIAGINEASTTAQTQIGENFDYARQVAELGIPVVQDAGARATGGINQVYDALAGTLAAMPQASVAQAAAAAGGVGNQAVADRVAASVAPFAAAGESSRAGAIANVAQHQQAGEQYLSSLASAAPTSAARLQGQVAGRASSAITQHERAHAMQVAQIQQQAAQAIAQAQLAQTQAQAEAMMQQAMLEGAQQRAILEASYDAAGSTFERLMQLAQLDASVTNPSLRQAMGLPPMTPAQMDPLELLSTTLGIQGQQLGLQNQALQNQQLALEISRMMEGPTYQDALRTGGNLGFDQALQSLGLDPKQQRIAEQFRRAVETTGVDPFALISGIDFSGSVGSRGQARGQNSLENLAAQIAMVSAGELDPEEVLPYTMPHGTLDEELLRQLARILVG